MKSLFLCLSLSCYQLAAQSLSKPELALINTIKKQQPQTEALLEKVVNINSGTLNKEGVQTVGKILADESAKLGFKTEWISFPDSLPVAGHLVATRQGTKGKKLFLIGHLDTVFEKNLPIDTYKQVTDSTATGQGVYDKKGEYVAIKRNSMLTL